MLWLEGLASALHPGTQALQGGRLLYSNFWELEVWNTPDLGCPGPDFRYVEGCMDFPGKFTGI